MSDLAISAAWNEPVQAGQHFKTVAAPWCKSMWAAGHRLHVEVRLHEDAKTDRQRAYYHGVVLKSIADQARPNDARFPLAVWKEHFRAEYLGFKTDIMSGAKAAEIKAAEIKADIEATEWALSPRELRIVDRLNLKKAQNSETTPQEVLFT